MDARFGGVIEATLILRFGSFGDRRRRLGSTEVDEVDEGFAWLLSELFQVVGRRFLSVLYFGKS